MTPIRGKNAYIEFDIGGFKKFGCAQTVSADGEAELRSVKTKGDGRHRRFRQYSTQYSISLSGLMVFDDPNMANAIDLAGNWKAGTSIAYRIYFDDDSGHISGLYGEVLVENFSLSGDTKFGRASFTFRGQGELNIGLPPTCTKAIAPNGYTFTRQGLTSIYKVQVNTLTSGASPVGRYDFRIDGGEIDSRQSNIFNINVAEYVPLFFGTHKLELWPVCDNGVRGSKTERNFTITIGS